MEADLLDDSGEELRSIDFRLAGWTGDELDATPSVLTAFGALSRCGYDFIENGSAHA